MFKLKELVSEPPIIGFQYDVSKLQSIYNRELPTHEQGLGHSKQQLRKLYFGEDENFYEFQQAFKESIPGIVSKFIEMDQKQKLMPKRWPTDKVDDISNRIQLQMFPIIDMPGYSLGSHLDQRTWFATGLLNVIDNHPVTFFTKRQHKNFLDRPFYTVEGKAGEGVLWLNTESTWHHMKTVPHERKIIQMNLVLL
jgi:hypothetical protein